MDRRFFLFATGGLSLSPFVPQSSQPTEAAKDVTRTLARYIVSAKPSDLPASVRKEAARTLLNWVGCTLGGSRHETVGIAISAIALFSGPAQASILGRKERLDILNAALINGISSHVLDYDDTHSRNIIHPAGPVISAILALSEHHPVSGNEFVNALVLGVDAECRIGNSVYPKHYDVGWHITGTAGVFGAAAASGKLLGLSEQQMLWALGLAATQPVGLQEMFGSMTKSFHPGRAAQNGLTAALLASKNFTSSEQSLEAKYGWANVVSAAHNYDDITKRLGESFEISKNTYKPFACGVVMHPTIDGCIQLRNENKLSGDEIDRVELRVHPLVMQLTSKKSPQTGLEGKFSIYHAASVALVEGAGGIEQFSDRAVRDRTIASLRDRVSTVVDSSLHEDQVRIAVVTKNGRRLEKFVEHAVGSLDHPMSDKDLEAKFTGLANGVLPPDRQRKLMDLCWSVEGLPKAAAVADAARVT
ncbi:MAG TPA: MmgE/PrpD family protein [Terriglobia bacterium]|nr:MmgE/PrpD family protein [Terriglobia bacterium]